MRIVIVGAGPGGLCMGIKLREAGLDKDGILSAVELFRSKQEKIAAQA